MVRTEFLKKFRSFKHRACGLAISAVLAVGMLPVMSPIAVQAKDEYVARSPQEIYDSVMKSNSDMTEPSAYGKQGNPYGYDVDVPFFLNQQSEILTWNSNDMDNEKDKQLSLSINSYDNLKSENYLGVYKDANINMTYNVPSIAMQLNYVQIKAFDPTGSGRNDHFAVIGVYRDNKKNYLYLFVGYKMVMKDGVTD